MEDMNPVISGEVSSELPEVSGEVRSKNREISSDVIGVRGSPGLSAYEVAVKNGYVGTEEEWLASLVGEPGYTPIKGIDYFDGTKGDPGKDGHSPIVSASKSGNSTTIFVDGSPIAVIVDGDPGVTPIITASKSGDTTTIYVNDVPIAAIKDGSKGDPGKDGYTPVRGVDYWTQADQDSIVDQVLESDEISALSDAIDDKIDKPSTAGTSGQVLTSDGNGGQSWEDPTGAVEDVQINGTSILDDGVANIPFASGDTYGLVRTQAGNGIGVERGALFISPASRGQVREGVEELKPITPYIQDVSAFFGLAKAAGDSTQSASENPVGEYTEEAKSAIQSMLDVPSTSDIPEVPVNDVQVNGTSVVSNGVANIPFGSNSIPGVFKINPNWGIGEYNGTLMMNGATSNDIKSGSNSTKAVSAYRQHESTFYGLAKAAGADMKNSDNAVGTYTDEAKTAIKSMIGIPTMQEIISAVHESYASAEEVSF